jgi:hypothetical protein
MVTIGKRLLGCLLLVLVAAVPLGCGSSSGRGVTVGGEHGVVVDHGVSVGGEHGIGVGNPRN